MSAPIPANSPAYKHVSNGERQLAAGRLSEAEMAVYDQEVATIDPPEREAVMRVVNEWEARGEAKGKVELIVGLLRRRLGPFPVSLSDRIESLPLDRLEALGDAMFDFGAVTDIESWLSAEAGT